LSPTGGGTALLVSPSLEGHRLVYCQVLARILTGMGYCTVVAAHLHRGGVAASPRLARLAAPPSVEMLDIDGGPMPYRATLENVATLIQQSRAEVTLLTEADDLLPALTAGVRRGRLLPGRVAGLFIRSTNYQYRPSPPLAARAKQRVRQRLGRTGITARAFHEGLLPRRHPVEAALVLDERYASRHATSHRWMPDIFRDVEEPAGEPRETAEWRLRVREFLATQPRRRVLAYIGTNQHRRGYDMLLRLALEEDACVLHCGRLALDGESSDADVRELRAALAARGALLETGGPYQWSATADLFLRAARCVVLPYRRHDGSSGVMLQALAAGRPVLVPGRGLMAYRARAFGVGETYCDGDWDDLRRRFGDLDRRGHAPYADAIDSYMTCFTTERLSAAVASAVMGSGEGARLPAERRGALVSGDGGQS